MVGITSPRKLRTAGLFDQVPPPTIDGVMSDARDKRGDGVESRISGEPVV
jgi:hypothetical protein